MASSALKGGYMGRRLTVDLTSGKTRAEPLDPGMIRDYVGTRGFIARILWEETERNVDPLGPENVLIFSTGPFAGTTIPSGSITILGFKSPLTGLYGFGTCGGHFACRLKAAGYDLLVVKGRAPRPVYIHIDNDRVTVRPAEHLWGLDLRQATRAVQAECGDPDLDVAAIGPAGENLVRGANVMVTMGHSASYGCGTVMGSKNLKAVAVRGTRGVTVADRDGYMRVWEEIMADIAGDAVVRGPGMRLGTTALVTTANALGELSTRNFQESHYPLADRISGEALLDRHVMKTRGCYACPVCCDRFSVLKEGEFRGTWVAGPEYATLTSYGSKWGNDDLPSILKANELSDQYGIDTYYLGDAVAFAMECYEKGILTREDTDGLELTWGNYRAANRLIANIATRTGYLGNLLADGATAAARAIGRGAEYYAIEIKGAAISSEDPRSNNENGLGAMLSTRGGDANNSWGRTTNYTVEMLDREWGIKLPGELRPAPGKDSRIGYGDLSAGLPTGIDGIGRLTKWWEERGVVVDLVGVCKFLWAALLESGEKLIDRIDRIARIYPHVTGVEADREKLLEAARRTLTLEKAYNVREQGAHRGHDRVPERFLKERVPSGPAEGKIFAKGDQFLDEYYGARGWHVGTGRPARETYEELDLSFVLEQLDEEEAPPR